MAVIDHLVLAVSDLGKAVDGFERDWGVRPDAGGRHQGLGTHNALVSFGTSYLELIAADPTQPDPDGPRPFGVDDIDDDRLVTWAARPDPTRGETLASLIGACRDVGHDPGDPFPMTRQTASGGVLSWQLTFPAMAHDGVIPFLIDWGDTTHPATSAPRGPDLTALGGYTTDARRANQILGALALPRFAVARGGQASGLHATFGDDHPVADRQE